MSVGICLKKTRRSWPSSCTTRWRRSCNHGCIFRYMYVRKVENGTEVFNARRNTGKKVSTEQDLGFTLESSEICPTVDHYAESRIYAQEDNWNRGLMSLSLSCAGPAGASFDGVALTSFGRETSRISLRTNLSHEPLGLVLSAHSRRSNIAKISLEHQTS